MRNPPYAQPASYGACPKKPAKKAGRSTVPCGSPPRGNHGWDILRTQAAIIRCNLPGAWYQGGQNDRITYTNDEQSYYIIQQSNTMWVQGRFATVINARLITSRPEAVMRA